MLCKFTIKGVWEGKRQNILAYFTHYPMELTYLKYNIMDDAQGIVSLTETRYKTRIKRVQ